jgi:anti-sigma factor RsiW
MTQRSIGCEQAVRLLATFLDGELDPLDHGDVERHLQACRGCYSRWEFERQLKQQLVAAGRREPDLRFAQRIRDLVRQFTQGPSHGPGA